MPLHGYHNDRIRYFVNADREREEEENVAPPRFTSTKHTINAAASTTGPPTTQYDSRTQASRESANSPSSLGHSKMIVLGGVLLVAYIIMNGSFGSSPQRG